MDVRYSQPHEQHLVHDTNDIIIIYYNHIGNIMFVWNESIIKEEWILCTF